LGIALSAQENNLPVVIGFTVETAGRLPSGESLQEAIELIDNETDSYPVYYMINCAHPSHFIEQFWSDNSWKNRIMAIRVNASKKSHEELDNSESLDIGDKCELALNYRDLKEVLPNLKVVGGCCGTDHTQIEEMCRHFM
jgi:S-methylmethionine-dependent homocysteine/selenocysteine methylase